MPTQPEIKKRPIKSGRKVRSVIRSGRGERPAGAGLNRRMIRGGAGSDGKESFLKTVGIILVATMMVGVAASTWFGWKIRSGLTDLERETVTAGQLENKYQALDAQRTGLLAKDVIEKKALALGLEMPEPAQIVRP